MPRKYKIFIVTIFLIFRYTAYAQDDFWEYKGLYGTFIGNITEDSEGRLYASEWIGLGDSIFFSDDKGNSWQSYGEVNESLFVSISSMITLDQNEIIVGTWATVGGGIYKSTDGSRTWIPKNTGLMSDIVTAVIKTSENLYISAYNGVYLSIDKGESWIKQNIEPNLFLDLADLIYLKNGDLFAIDFNDVFRSTDKGVTWDTTISGIEHGNFCCLAVSTEEFLFLGLNGGGIYRSSNFGNNWELNRPSTFVRNLAKNSFGHIMAGTEFQGILLTKDNGESWEQINSGLPFPPKFINSVFFDSEGYAYCSIHNFGVYKSSSPIVGVKDDQGSSTLSYILYQNYPNPFNSITKIPYQIKEPGLVQLIVYDVLGREVATLVNENKPSGSHSVEFNAATLPSGIYFYKLTSGQFTSVKKLILMK